MKSIQWRNMTPWLLAAIIAVPSSAWTEELDLAATRSAVITSDSEGARLLVAFPDVSPLLEDQWVTNATLLIPLGSTALSSDLMLGVEALATSWGDSPTWTSPWTTPGGDLDETLGSSAEVAAGTSGGTLTVDVTDIVRGWVEAEIVNAGLTLLPVSEDRAGFTPAETALLGSGMATSSLHVYYRDMKALGYQGGMKALLARRRSAVVDEDRR